MSQFFSRSFSSFFLMLALLSIGSVHGASRLGTVMRSGVRAALAHTARGYNRLPAAVATSNSHDRQRDKRWQQGERAHAWTLPVAAAGALAVAQQVAEEQHEVAADAGTVPFAFDIVDFSQLSLAEQRSLAPQIISLCSRYHVVLDQPRGCPTCAQWLKHIKQLPHLHIVCLRHEGKVSGYGAYVDGGSEGLVSHLAIDPRDQGKGYGSALMEYILTDLKRRGCSVAKLQVTILVNPPPMKLMQQIEMPDMPMLRLCKAHGFVPQGAMIVTSQFGEGRSTLDAFFAKDLSDWSPSLGAQSRTSIHQANPSVIAVPSQQQTAPSLAPPTMRRLAGIFRS